jgi:hypothetical protein
MEKVGIISTKLAHTTSNLGYLREEPGRGDVPPDESSLGDAIIGVQN